MAQSDNLLTEQEKVQIRHFLGFLNTQEVPTFILGTPTAVETQFIIEQAMNLLKAEALPLVRRLIVTLTCIEEKMLCVMGDLGVSSVGDIKFNNDAPVRDGLDKVHREYEFWKGKLANALGVYANPFDKSKGFHSSSRKLGVSVR